MHHNVAHFLAQQASLYPDKPAVRAPLCRDKSGVLSYTERSFLKLEEEASSVAQILLARGIQRGTRVLLMVKPGLDLICIVFALFKIGAVPIVIDPGMGLREFLRCVKHSKPRAVVGIPLAIWISRFFYASFRAVKVRVTVGLTLARVTSKRKQRNNTFPVVDSNSDDLAAILFTSGSTGPAKGVCYTHGMFTAQVEAIRVQYQMQPGEIDLPMLPVFALFNP
ncbi:MAG: AMP-binding protein, partial [Verrucomicrobiota bacterium]|nr:AMP-binding protein [Verrucomicrobiota bacterium]